MADCELCDKNGHHLFGHYLCHEHREEAVEKLKKDNVKQPSEYLKEIL